MAGPLDRAYIEITANLDTRQAERAAKRAGKAVEDELTDSVKRAERSMTSEAARAGEAVGKTLSDATGDALGDGLRRNAAGRLVDARGRFVSAAKAEGRVIGDTLGESIGDGIGGGGTRSGSIFGRRFTAGFQEALSSIVNIKLPVAGFAALGLGLASAAASAVQLAAALAPAVGIVATLPSGIGLLTAGISTLNVATLGVGDAFEAAFGDAEAFNEAIEGMAPNVQDAAQALRDLSPELDGLRDKVQQAFFQDFDGVLNSLADTLLGPVTSGMTAVADAANGVIQGLASVATSSTAVDFVTQSFSIMASVIQGLQEPLTALFGSLLNVGTAINEAFGQDIGTGLADAVTQFAAFLNQAAATGQATQWVQDALTVFASLRDILGSLVGIIQSVGSAAAATGGNILGVFGQALEVVNSFLASAQGQSALISVFEALNQVGQAFGTVLAGIAPAIPPLVSGIASILGVVAPLLGPLSQLVGSVLTALAPILGVIAAAIQPLIGPLTEVIELIGPILVDAITAVMPLIELLADLLGGALGVAIQVVAEVLEALSPILTVLLDALSPIIEALQPLFDLLGVVADIIGAVLAPIIQVLGDILLWLANNVIVPFVVPIIQFLADLLTGLLGDAINWLVTQFQLAGEGIKVIWEFIKNTIGDRIEEITDGFSALVTLFQAGWQVLNDRVFTPLKNGFISVKNAAVNQLALMRSGFNGIVDFFKGIPGRIKGALSSIFTPLATGFKSAINSVISGWNSLSFTVPSVDLGPLGSVGGFTVSTPNIPYLARGALATGPTLAMVGEGSGPEAILPLEDPRVTDLLASALSRAGVSGRATAGADAGSVSAVGRSGDNFFVVKIGERELTDIVIEQQNAMNQQMLRRARSGTRRNH
jgi:phage-related protein